MMNTSSDTNVHVIMSINEAMHQEMTQLIDDLANLFLIEMVA